MKDIHWTDNQGGAGDVKRNSYHQQEYYPLWIKEPLTFKGTLLPKTSYKEGNLLKVNVWRYGYVDNLPNNKTDGLYIEHAVDADRKPVKLDKIDFVRVYTAVNDWGRICRRVFNRSIWRRRFTPRSNSYRGTA